MKKILFIVFLCLSFSLIFATSPDFEVKDNPNDAGHKVCILWDTNGIPVSKIKLFKMKDSEFMQMAELNPTNTKYLDKNNISPNQKYFYKIEFYDLDGNLIHAAESSCTTKIQWFNTKKISTLILGLIITIAIVFFIASARSGKDLYIRKIAGLESVDDAVGRATEMGRPVLYIPGTADVDNMQTIAGLTILGTVAQKAAEYNTRLIVPVSRAMVLSTAREIVKEAYMKVGREDLFKKDDIFYLTNDQFGYVSGVDGIIVREKPAANFFLGSFYAESLILAETGFAAGSIQVSGTAMPSQLPFFVAACDYTLIGEELFAASAYLSKNPQQLGSLKGQDIGKAVFVIVLIIGVILEISNVHFLKDFLISH